MIQKTLPGFPSTIKVPEAYQNNGSARTDAQLAKERELAEGERFRRDWYALRARGTSAKRLLAARAERGFELPPAIVPGFDSGRFRSRATAALVALLGGAYRIGKHLAVEASARELGALLGVSERTAERAVDEAERAGELRVCRRVLKVGALHPSQRSRAQVRNLYALPYARLAVLAGQHGRTLPTVAVLLDLPTGLWKGCAQRVNEPPPDGSRSRAVTVASQSGNSFAEEASEQSVVDKSRRVPEPRSAAETEGIEGEAASAERRARLLVRTAVALFVLVWLACAGALVSACDRAPLDAPGDTASLLDAGAGDADGAPPACRCALRAAPDAACAPGCPGGLCCEAAP